MNIDTPITKNGGYDDISRCFALNSTSEKFSPKEAADPEVRCTGEKIYMP